MIEKIIKSFALAAMLSISPTNAQDFNQLFGHALKLEKPISEMTEEEVIRLMKRIGIFFDQEEYMALLYAMTEAKSKIDLYQKGTVDIFCTADYGIDNPIIKLRSLLVEYHKRTMTIILLKNSGVIKDVDDRNFDIIIGINNILAQYVENIDGLLTARDTCT